MKTTNNILTDSIFMNVNMNWQNVQNMSKKERQLFINKVVSLSQTNCGFIEYGAKFHLIHIIHNSECYFNYSGLSTPVKEFKKLGWYNEQGNLDISKIINQN